MIYSKKFSILFFILTLSLCLTACNFYPQQSYNIEIEDCANGTITASKTSASPGEKITLTATALDDFRLSSFIVTSNDAEITVTDSSFKMPNGNVTVSAIFVTSKTEFDIQDFCDYLNNGKIEHITANESAVPGISWSTDGKSANVYGVVLTGETELSNKFNVDTKKFFPQTIIIADLRGLNTSNVTSLRGMFEYCRFLTYVDLSNFDTSNITDMAGMFVGCSSLSQLDVTKFDTSKVTDMSCMFSGCSSLTQLDVTKFDTSKVTDMGSMFANCSSLSQLDVTKFDTSKVTEMGGMFFGCDSLTQLDVTKFDTSKVTGMCGMFEGLKLSSLNVTNFDTSNVKDMSWMFSYCSSLTQLDVTKFNTSKVYNMREMFFYCSSLTQLDVTKFDTSNVNYMNDMFNNCRSLTQLDVTNFDTSKVTDMSEMFSYCSSLTTIYASKKFVRPNKSNNIYTNDSSMFIICNKLKGGSGTVYDSSKVDGTYARIDGGSKAPGYFTAKK